MLHQVESYQGLLDYITAHPDVREQLLRTPLSHRFALQSKDVPFYGPCPQYYRPKEQEYVTVLRPTPFPHLRGTLVSRRLLPL